MPQEIITDQGKEFCAKLTKDLFQLLQITHLTTTADHPQCNSQAEVANKTIAKYLTSYVSDSTSDWEDYLAPMMFSHNISSSGLPRTPRSSLHMEWKLASPRSMQLESKSGWKGPSRPRRSWTGSTRPDKGLSMPIRMPLHDNTKTGNMNLTITAEISWYFSRTRITSTEMQKLHQNGQGHIELNSLKHSVTTPLSWLLAES